jgi:Regulator of ribonuclease activity B
VTDNLNQAELAIETLKLFTDNGEDMSEIRHVLHYFYDGNFEALGNALGELGYSIRPTVDNDGVIAERDEAIGEEWRTTTLIHLCKLANSYGVEYDGWEAAMTGLPKADEENQSSRQSSGWLSKIFGKK